MAGVNLVIILGRLGRDPEITYTPEGLAVCKFTLATSKKKKDSSEVVSWHRCIAFDKRAETIAKYVSKGQELFIEGELSYSQYEKDRIKRYVTDIHVTSFTFISGHENKTPQYSQQQNNNQPNNNKQPNNNSAPYSGDRY